MSNFRDELREIFNTDWDDNGKFEAIDELHEKYLHKHDKLPPLPEPPPPRIILEPGLFHGLRTLIKNVTLRKKQKV